MLKNTIAVTRELDGDIYIYRAHTEDAWRVIERTEKRHDAAFLITHIAEREFHKAEGRWRNTGKSKPLVHVRLVLGHGPRPRYYPTEGTIFTRIEIEET